MKCFIFLAALLLICVPFTYGQFVMTNLDKGSVSLLDSAYRNATATTADQSLPLHRGIRVSATVIDTQNAGYVHNLGLIVTIQGKDPATSTYFTLLQSDTLFVEGTTTSFIVHPDITAVTNLMAKDLVPRSWRVQATLTDSGYINYKIGGEEVR